MNLKVRMKNPVFWVQLIVVTLSVVGSAFSLQASDITSWSMLGELIVKTFSNPYVLWTIVVAVWGVLNDPTTKGIGDSEQAKTYTKPNS